MRQEFRRPAHLACAAFLLLSACGGGSPSTGTAGGDPIPGNTSTGGGTTSGGGTPGAPGGTDTGGSTGGGGVATGGLIFPDALNPTIAELGGIEPSTREFMVSFSALNALPSIERPTVGLANFDGGMAARIGDGEEFMVGQVRKTINFRTSTGTGTILPLRISGNDVTDVLRFDLVATYDIIIDRVTTTEFSGIVTGSAGLAPFGPVDSYTINDAVIDGRYIDNRTNLDTIGTIRGTITSNAGTRPLDGVLYASPLNWTN